MVRGRGYTPWAECGIERSRSDCSLCNGKKAKGTAAARKRASEAMKTYCCKRSISMKGLV
ncbi:Hypothetical predicted protein [Olea europaea subsp. europaea]|uniref:Uncharacterized protein n=1 Tax=Olea europaea subsp. europaea TaxID=158383 RepID=A0A8S0UXF8_OLEEU|nr:Hypothetical predicted protein [Olea europaea subsp. europaea]